MPTTRPSAWTITAPMLLFSIARAASRAVLLGLSTTMRGRRYHLRDISELLWMGKPGGELPGHPFAGLHAPALQTSSYGALGAGEGAVDRSLERSISFFEDHARQAVEDHLDPTHLIDPAPRAVHVLDADADALDGRRELPELHAQLSPDVRAVVAVEFIPERPDVSGDARRNRSGGLSFERLRDPARKRSAFLAV